MKIKTKVSDLFLQIFICIVILFLSNCISTKTKQLDGINNCISKIQVEFNRKLKLNYDFDCIYTYRVLINGNEMKELNVNKQNELMVEIFQSVERIIKPVLLNCTSVKSLRM